MQYVKDTAVADKTPPPAPTNVRVSGNELSWEAEADLESGLASFIIERDGKFLANVPEQGQEPLRPARLSEPAVQRHAHAAAGADAIHRLDRQARRQAHLPCHCREHRGPEVEAECGCSRGRCS